MALSSGSLEPRCARLQVSTGTIEEAGFKAVSAASAWHAGTRAWRRCTGASAGPLPDLPQRRPVLHSRDVEEIASAFHLLMNLIPWSNTLLCASPSKTLRNYFAAAKVKEARV